MIPSGRKRAAEGIVLNADELLSCHIPAGQRPIQAYWKGRFDELWKHSSANTNVASGKDEEAAILDKYTIMVEWDTPLCAVFIYLEKSFDIDLIENNRGNVWKKEDYLDNY